MHEDTCDTHGLSFPSAKHDIKRRGQAKLDLSLTPLTLF